MNHIWLSMQRRLFLSAFSSLALGAWTPPTWAQASGNFPARTVKIVIPYAAGGGPDVLLRKIAPKLESLLGQTLVLENKVGAAGVLAANYVSMQPADGYTLLMGSNTHLVQKLLQPSLKFDPLNDFVPVTNFAWSPTVLVVAAQSEINSVDALVAYAKRNAHRVNYASGGIGTSAHLAGATLATLGGFEAEHIPLKGSVEITASLLRGDTQYAFPVSGTAIPQVHGGRLKALAVTSAHRLKELPDVPTLQEALGQDLAVQDSWFGFWAPKGTPDAIVQALHIALSQVLEDVEVQKIFEAAGNQVAKSRSAAEFRSFVQDEALKWEAIVKLADVKAS